MARSLGIIRLSSPPAAAGDLLALFAIAARIIRAYTRGVCLDALLVGAILSLGYFLIGLDAWLLLGVVALLGEIVPVVGSWLALAISVPVVLITQPDRILLALALCLTVQLVDTCLLEPRIQGGSLHFTTPVSLLLLVSGGIIAGPLGLILVLPVAALLRDMTRYLSDRAAGLSPSSALGRHAAIQRGRVAERPGQS